MLMNKFDFIEFELSAHTDATGPDHYNQLLSEKRANGVLNYLLDMQVKTDRLVAIGYGESNPAVVCPDQQPCAPYQNRINRRTEFRLIYINDNQVVSNY